MEKSRNLSLKAWFTICVPKREGGLGIRLMAEVNSALVSKLAWTMLTKRDSLWVRVSGGKYLRGNSVREAEAAVNDSWLWKSIVDVNPQD